jgi:hypothetical protein
MDWTGGRNEQILAGVYLASWVSWLIGVVWTLISQLTAGLEFPQPVIAGALFFGGVVGMTALAYLLRNRVPRQAGRFMAKATNYQRAWYRLTLGIELPRAWRALTGSVPGV